MSQTSDKDAADSRDISDAIDRSGVARLNISLAQLLMLAELPIHHRDPFDHLLIAQAITEGAEFMSEDRDVLRYPVKTIGCSG